MYHQIVCVKCQIRLKPKKNEVGVLDIGNDGKPFYIWDADLWECPNCGIEVVTGFGQRPMANHTEEKFEDIVRQWKADGTVIECWYEKSKTILKEGRN